MAITVDGTVVSVTAGPLNNRERQAIANASAPSSTNPFLTASVGIAASGSNPTTLAANGTGGSSTVTLTDTTGYIDGVYVDILLDDGTIHTSTQNGAPSGSVITLDDALPSSGTVATSGNYVSIPDLETVLARNVGNTDGTVPTLATRINQIGVPGYNLESYGMAAGNSAADNDTGLASLVSDLGSNPGLIYAPPGTFEFTSTLVLRDEQSIVGEGENSELYNNSGNVVELSVAATAFSRHNHIRDIYIRAGSSGGHCIAIPYGVTLGEIGGVRCLQQNPAKSVIYGLFNFSNGGFLDMEIHNCEFEMNASASVPGIYLVADGTRINENEWHSIRCHAHLADEYFFHLENTANSTYLRNNTFRNINFEQTRGGAMLLRGMQRLLVECCTIWDLSGETTTGHMFDLDASTGGSPLSSRYCTFRQVARTSGTLGVGKRDIFLRSANYTILDTCQDGTAAGTTHDINSKSAIIFNRGDATYNNIANTNAVYVDNDELQVPTARVTTVEGIASNSVTVSDMLSTQGLNLTEADTYDTATIASGTFAKGIDTGVVVTSESGTSDTLDTVTGGVNGELLLLSPANTHAITITHDSGADGFYHYTGANIVLNDTKEIALYIYRSSRWCWIGGHNAAS